MTSTGFHQHLIAVAVETDNQRLLSPMKRTDKIVVVGYVWNSRQNGMVLDIRGVSPCFTVGQHSGVEPKIRVVYEVD